MKQHVHPIGRRANLSVCVAAVALSLMLGCGRSMVSVSGTVFLDGQPATDGYVSFVPTDGRSRGATGKIDSSGKFTLSTFQDGDGVALGEYLVAVATGETPAHRDERGTFHPTTYASPAKYANPQTSGLTASVADKPGQTFEFRLER